MSSIQRISRCRISSDESLISVVNLGYQRLTGVFPSSPGEDVTRGPLELVWSSSSNLLQLAHSYNPLEMYGENYGYRSGLNKSMVSHLRAKVRRLESLIELSPKDVVLDIGSNDGTTLNAYKMKDDIRRLGIDPTASKLLEFYDPDIQVIPQFFSSSVYHSADLPPAKLITSIAMFYDLEDPVEFVRQIRDVLDSNGIWHFEQSYLPSMLRTNAYDTICHEHLEYYTVANVDYILALAGMRIVDLQFNSVNGGSFAVTACKDNSTIRTNNRLVSWYLNQEKRMGLDSPKPFRDFEARIYEHRNSLRELVLSLKSAGSRISGYGASTKGNVLLQFCGFDQEVLDYIVDVNPYKYGRFTPGTGIPIISEEEAACKPPDYFLVLPWHFREGILSRETSFLQNGVQFIFPLPEIEIVSY